MNEVERRLELLQMEGTGFDQKEIVKHLSEKYHVHERTVYYDFQKREGWQPALTQVKNKTKMFFKVINRYEQIYRKASFMQLQAQNENAQVGALKVMLDANTRTADMLSLQRMEVPVDTFKVEWKSNELERAAWKEMYDKVLTKKEKDTLQKIISKQMDIRKELEKETPAGYAGRQPSMH